MILSDVDMMVESILMVMDEHGCEVSGGRQLTAEEVVALPETEIITLLSVINNIDEISLRNMFLK